MLKEITLYTNEGDTRYNYTKGIVDGNFQTRDIIAVPEEVIEVLENATLEEVQNILIGITQEHVDDSQSNIYQDYEPKFRKTISKELNSEGAKEVKKIYLNSKTQTIRNKVIVDVLNCIIKNGNPNIF